MRAVRTRNLVVESRGLQPLSYTAHVRYPFTIRYILAIDLIPECMQFTQVLKSLKSQV